MEYGLERKLKRDLFGYCFLHPRFYEDIDRYVAADVAYREVVAPLLPACWEVRPERLWYAALPPDLSLPGQGFKIHLSATWATAHELLRRVVPILARAETAFKFVADPAMLDYMNSKNYPRTSSGKFITIYPADQERCGTLLESLHEATVDLKGPHILSDRAFRHSKVVFYRYGGFMPQFQLTIYGDRLPVIQAPDGQWIPDARGPAFQLPPGTNDPFLPQPTIPPAPPLLHGRFKPESAESFSNSGGVYAGRDTSNQQRVIIKEARPGTCSRKGSSSDATTVLAKEYKVLTALQPTGYVPAAIDYFQEWDHHFLVEEYVEGIPLSNYRALEEVGLLVNRTGSADSVSKFCDRLRRITRSLIDAVEACHKNGIVLGDLAPDNIIIDEKTLAIRLIDFEGAVILAENGDSDQAAMATLGFVSPRRLLGEPLSYADDWYSLGSVIYSLILPLQPFFHLYPEAQDVFLNEVAKDQGLPPEVSNLISALFEGSVERAKEIVTGNFSNATLRRASQEPSKQVLDATLDGITSHILKTIDTTRNDRLFPGDYRVFSTNPLSVSFGAVGQALYLQSALGSIPANVTEWILRQPVTTADYAPGLYVGLAGVSWGLAELGLEGEARDAMLKAYESPLLFESLDVFYGCAGTGLASLYWWNRTGERRFLERATELGDYIVQSATGDEAGYYWLNIDGGHHFGYAHGGSGISLFLLYLYRATQDSRYLQYAIGGLDYEIAQAKHEAGYVVWSRTKESAIMSPYWRYGNAGIGSVLIRFYSMLKNPRYLEYAEKAARYTASKYAGFPGQFMGLSGMGEFLLDMHRFTGDPDYRSEALKIAAGVLLYAVPEPQGTAFPGEELLRLSTDYGTGSAGIGMFLQRILQPGNRLFHDLLWDDLTVGQDRTGPLVEVESLDYECAR